MEYIYYLLVGCFALRIAHIDFKEKSIYDIDLLKAAVVIILYSIYSLRLLPALLGGLAGFAVGYLIYFVSFQYYKTEAFGFGDVFLLGVFGLFFGYPSFIHYFSIVIISSGILAALLLVLNREYAHSYFPLAPIFVVGGLVFKILGEPTPFEVCLDVVCWVNGVER